MFGLEKIDSVKLSEIVAETGVDCIADLARSVDLNPTTLYRIKQNPGKVLGRKSTRKLLDGLRAFRALKAGAQAG